MSIESKPSTRELTFGPSCARFPMLGLLSRRRHTAVTTGSSSVSARKSDATRAISSSPYPACVRARLAALASRARWSNRHPRSATRLGDSPRAVAARPRACPSPRGAATAEQPSARGRANLHPLRPCRARHGPEWTTGRRDLRRSREFSAPRANRDRVRKRRTFVASSRDSCRDGPGRSCTVPGFPCAP